MDLSLWAHLPHDMVLEVIKRVDDIDTRRAFGVYAPLSPQRLQLQIQHKSINKGHWIINDYSISWAIAGKKYTHCRMFARNSYHDMLLVSHEGVFRVLWEQSVPTSHQPQDPTSEHPHDRREDAEGRDF